MNPTAVHEDLIQAAWDNDLARAEELIAEGGDVNYRDGTQQSAYLIATSEGYLDLLELTLARHGPTCTALDRFDGTGLIRAAERGHGDIVGRLLQTEAATSTTSTTSVGRPCTRRSSSATAAALLDTVRVLVAGGTRRHPRTTNGRHRPATARSLREGTTATPGCRGHRPDGARTTARRPDSACSRLHVRRRQTQPP